MPHLCGEIRSMQEAAGVTIRSQLTEMVDELETGTKGESIPLKLAICNLLGAANVLAERHGIRMDELMQTYDSLWAPVVDAMIGA